MNTHVAYTVNQNDRQHPGARVIEPAVDDAYAVRGKLYIVLELFPVRIDDSQPQEYSGALFARVNKQITNAIQEAYYSAKGSHLQVAQAALQNGQQALRALNSQHPATPFGAGMGIVALLGNRLVVATSGPVISLLASATSIQQFPSEASTSLAGVDGQPEAEIQTFQRSIENDSAIFLGSSAWLKYIPSRELLGMVAHLTHENSQEAARYVSQQSRFATIPGLFLTVGSGTNAASTATLPTADPPTDPLPRSTGGLPTAVHATTRSQPAQKAPQISTQKKIEATYSAEVQVEQLAKQPSPREEARVAPLPLPPQMQRDHRTLSDVQVVREQGQPEQVSQVRTESSTGPSTIKRASTAVSAAIGQSGAACDRILTPDGADDVEPRRVRRESSREPTMSEAEYRASKGWNEESIAEPLYIEPVAATGRRARLFLTLAALIFVLVPVAVFALVVSQGISSRAQAESMIDAAAAKIASAEIALDSGSNGVASTELNDAQTYLAEASRLAGDRSRISQLSARMEQNFRAVSVIVPLYMLVDPLVRFPADASPSRVMVVNQDVYILDRGRNHVQRFRLDPSGKMISDPTGEVVLRQGDRIDGFDVGPLVDMAWQTPVVGNEEKSNLVVLDGNNQVFRYNQVVDGPSRLAFGNQELWQSPTQIQSYLGRFYIADSGSGQIYRYSPGLFDAEPDEWLSTPTSLASVLSMKIDGDIWMLFSSGLLGRYNEGRAASFALNDDVGRIAEPVDMFIGDQDDSLIYIADAAAQRILVFKKNGEYLRQYQADDGAELRDLRGIFVDEITKKIYILTQSTLYQHPLAE